MRNGVAADWWRGLAVCMIAMALLVSFQGCGDDVNEPVECSTEIIVTNERACTTQANDLNCLSYCFLTPTPGGTPVAGGLCNVQGCICGTYDDSGQFPTPTPRTTPPQPTRTPVTMVCP